MYIDTDIREDICILYLNKPDTNSLNQELLNELYDKVSWVTEHKTIKVVILESKLSFGFSSGLDLRSLMDAQQSIFAEKVYNAVYKSFQIAKTIVQSSKIFIASISGPIIGSAVSIVFSCDFRIAAPGSWFWLPDTQYGGLLADGGIELLAKLSGNSQAFMLSLTNDRINLDQANEWGLIYKVAELQKLEETTFIFAKRLCGLSVQTMSLHKKIINKGLLSAFPEAQLRDILASEDVYKKLQLYIRNIHKL